MRVFAHIAGGLFLGLITIGCSDGGGGTGGGGTGPDGGSAPGPSASSSSSSSSPTPTPSAKKKLGDNCTNADECADGKCLQFTGNDGQTHGFCTRQCTKAADCPESGWECNLAPYTACVPSK